ncbi:unnamed protein product, partial [Rotaria sp. Silwood2]
MITVKNRQHDVAFDLLNLLRDLKFTLFENTEMNLFKFIDSAQLTLGHLDVAGSLETCIAYLSYLFKTHDVNDYEYVSEVSSYLDRLLQENHFTIQLSDVAFVLRYLKNQAKPEDNGNNSGVIRQIQCIFEKSDRLRTEIEQYFKNNNNQFSLNDLPLISDIIFHCYNDSLLYGIDRRKFILETLIKRNDSTIIYFLNWFKFLLCTSPSNWMDYNKLLKEWTKCFVDNRDIFFNIINHTDNLIQLWAKATVNNAQSCNFFIEHMIEQCFNQGIISKSKCIEILYFTILQLKTFQSLLQNVCDDERSPIKCILQLFPDEQKAKNDVNLLKNLLEITSLSLIDTIILFWTNRSRIQHTCKGLINLNKKVSFQIDSNFLDNVYHIKEETSIIECASIYEQYQNRFDVPFSTDILKLISYYSSASHLFDFLHSVTTYDICNLQEAVNDWDETLVNTKTMFDIATVKNFLDRSYEAIRIKRQELADTPLQLEHIIICFENIKNNEQFNDLFKCIESSSDEMSSITRIHLELTDKEKSKRRQIADILRNSIVDFSYVAYNDCIFDVNVRLQSQKISSNVETKTSKITFIDLSDLRDRVRLLEYSSNISKRNLSSMNSENDIENLRNFIRFVDVIESTLETLKMLYVTGHLSFSEFTYHKKQNIFSFSCIDGEYDNLCENDIKLTNLFNEWDKKLCAMYKKHIDLTYFSCNQFWLIEDYIYHRQSVSHPGYHLLKYIGINPDSIEQPSKRRSNAEDRLDDLGYLLSQQEHECHKICSNLEKAQLIETTPEGILRAILSLCALMKTPVYVHHIFYCTKNTDWIQIRAFVYRCFYSQSLQILIQPEILSQAIQDQFVSLLCDLREHNSEQKFHLGIITTTTITNQQLINGLQSMQILKLLRDQELLHNTDLQKNIYRLIQNCTIVTSKIAGLGKSSFIRHEIELSKKNYIKFPIYGDFDADTLAERLQSKFSQLKTGAIHFDIGLIDNIQQLNQILYCLLLFGSFRFEQVAASIPRETSVFIELGISLESILTPLTLFKYVNRRITLDQIEWKTLNITDPKIQTVAKYLQAIDSGTIIKENIDPSTFSSLDLNICSRLISSYFLSSKDSNHVNWTQLSIFVAVFNHLFTSFSYCGYFRQEYIPNQQLRMDLVRILLACSNQFTSLSVDAVRKQQEAAITDKTISLDDAILRWDKIQPFTLFFTSTHEPLFVYKSPANVPKVLKDYFKAYYKVLKQDRMNESSMFPDYAKLDHAQLFIKLTSLLQKYINKSICLKCFRQYEFQEQECQNTKCTVIKNKLERPKSFDGEDVKQFQLLVAKELQKQYILTPDNFMKILLIYMRVQSGVAVIEKKTTFVLGCGKTTLIQFLCQKILDDELKVFRIHAGVTADQIVKTIQEYIIQAEECAKQGKRLWVFFDEFNTTTNIGLLKEIMCDRTLLGEILPSNIVFLGACNPLRQRTHRIKLNNDPEVGLRKNRYEMQKLANQRLLYTVVPIPETMLEYIWNYGHLDESTERAYIRTMLNTCCDLSSNSVLLNLTLNMLVESHDHYRKLEDVSSVSLRDIARFCRLYNWFLNSLTQRDYKDQPHKLSLRASLLALMLCYYFRSRSSQLRQIYIDKMEYIMKNSIGHLIEEPNISLNNILESEQKRLIDERMKNLPPGIALNQVIRDNIFVILICILNHIPVFLCGKPGSSKSLAVQTVINNLKGKKSSDTYFQQLPELVVVSFQGSQNCTSESVTKVFDHVTKFAQVKGTPDLLPVIVFDEIGLAELSPHNPLKVLHAELEVEVCGFGFVGISNWRLDASKMNRALYLSVPEPDINDLSVAGRAISQAMTSNIPNEENIIKSLAKAYHDLRTNLEGMQPDHENYFGLRDYYSLIKGIMRDLVTENDQTKIYEIIRRQLKINFDGILDSSFLLWQQFCYDINKEHLLNEYRCPTFDFLLDQALDVRSGRYLMLIADNESMIDYVERYICVHQQKKNIPIRTLVGSSFPGDLLSSNTYAEQYNYRILMDIILYAEMNVTLIMRQMGHLYDKLYDLFNQNYAVSAKKQYCRIALGPLYHPRCLINDNFYCIVFIHKQDLDKCDPPFLNRFEKHYIEIQTLVHLQHQLLTRTLHAWLESLIPKNLGKHFPLIQHLFVDYSPDRICNLVIKAFEQLNIHIDDQQTDEQGAAILNYCREHLMHTSSFDLPVVLSLNSTSNNQMLINQYYDKHQSVTFKKLIEQSLEKNQIESKIIYTYTQIFHQINIIPSVEEVKLGAFKTELEFTKKIKHHYQASTNIRLLLIRVDYHSEQQHILSLKHILLNQHVSKSNRGVWILFHLQRNLLNQVNNDILFNDWSVYMIDDLHDRELISRDNLEHPSYFNLVLQPKYRLSRCAFDRLVDQSLSKFRYRVFQTNFEGRIIQRRKEHFEQLIKPYDNSTINNLHLRSIVEKYFMNLIEKNILPANAGFKDWRLDLLTNGLITAGSRSFQDAFQTTISNFYEVHMSLLLAHLEKYNLIDAHIFLSTKVHDEKIQKYLSQLWENCFTSTLEKIDVTRINVDIIEIPLVFDLKLPCAAAEYKTIQSIRERYEHLKNFSSDKIDDFLDQVHTSSFYGEDFIELIANNEQLFEFYFHDQILMHLIETKIHLSPEFVYELLTSNPIRSFKQYKRVLLVEYIEFTDILRLFETSLQLISETNILDIIRNQFIENPIGQIKSSEFYTLVLANQQFYQLPPKTTIIEDQWKFECNGNPIIETSLMNLIEYILSPSVIDHAINIQQIITIYSLIAQGIFDLSSYCVNNLERLRSFNSLVRCLTAILSDKALDVLKDVSKTDLNAKFTDCSSIRYFIKNLEIKINQEHSTVDKNIVHEALVKLEIEFIKHWLADNIDLYGIIFTLLNGQRNDLWRYSARIFTIIIDQKLKLISTLKENHGKLLVSDEYTNFNESLKMQADPLKIQRLLVNRIHMHLMLDIQGDEIDERLNEYYPYFEENFNAIQSQNHLPTGQFISCIAWLKFYAQMYAFALHNDNKGEVMNRINSFLTMTNTPFGSTLKLFILKQLLQTSEFTLNGLHDVYINRNVSWIKLFLQYLRSPQVRNINQQFVFLPVPGFECRTAFKHFRKAFIEFNQINQIRELISECDTKQESAYACLCWFIQYYYRTTLLNTSIDNTFRQLIEYNFRDDLIRSFTLLGHKFIICLCSNFSNESYFRLHPNMTPLEVHKRLLALNIVAVFISFRSRSEITLLGNILFDAKRKMPAKYIQHLSSIYLPGLTVSDSPQDQMLIVESLQKTNDDINRYNQASRLGYYVVKMVETSTLYEKPDHLDRPLSFRFVHFLTHGLLLFLFDQSYLTENDLKEHLKLPTITFFRDHFEKDYTLLAKASTDSHQCYIWLYKLLSHLVSEPFAKQGLINTNENVIEIEKLIEQKLLFEHINSITSEIIKYKTDYVELMTDHITESSSENIIDELCEDKDKFPHLHFFNVTKFYTSNPLDEFILKLETRPYAEQIYPVTTFLLKHLDDYTNIKHLYPIVYFTNYLIEKFNHRIKRSDAIEKKIAYYLKSDKDREITQKLFNKFLDAWYVLDLKELRYGCQSAKFERNVSKQDFAENTSLAMLLLNQSRDDSSFLLLACLKTLAEMQNKIVNYFDESIECAGKTLIRRKCVPLQSIRPEHIFCYDRNELNIKLVYDSLVLNYEYGKGKEAIYDYEEIEVTLRNQISSLVLIDTDKIHFLTYQFELYGENTSLINDVRARIKQERLPNDDRTKLYRFIHGLFNDDVLHYLGSLDYIFTYLGNDVVDKTARNMTIQSFVDRYITTYACLNDNIVSRTQFSTIELRYIIDLYEILEENAFDRILRTYIKKELQEESFSNEERRQVVDRFCRATFKKETIAPSLKAIDCWISMLKRLMVRVLTANVSLDGPLELYLQRTDLWNVPIDDAALETFQVDNDILLKHTYVIL